ncbi:MAG: hypothetical protein LWY06_11470 [Firmicutes bacterium]|nr:hypothetical protein [Bacillota bacterium]
MNQESGRLPEKFNYRMIIAVSIVFLIACSAAGYWYSYYQQSRRHYRECKANLEIIGIAIYKYADDHNGKCPFSLEDLVPDYLPAIPCCPAAGKNTYSRLYRKSDVNCSFCCAGGHHKVYIPPFIRGMEVFRHNDAPENRPGYTASGGVIP